jgi:hypothetical protein
MAALISAVDEPSDRRDEFLDAGERVASDCRFTTRVDRYAQIMVRQCHYKVPVG